jgi:hypothetical protein
MGKKPYKPKREEHPFVEPRFVAAGGLMALGLAVGWGLMFARILVVVGLVVALASSVAVISIYVPHFKRAYRALKKREKYEGAGLVELIVAVVMVTMVAVLSPVIYLNVQADEISLNRAELRLDGLAPYKLPAGTSTFQDYLVNVVWTNRGTLTLTDGRLILHGRVVHGSEVLPKEIVDRELDDVEKDFALLNHSNVADVLSGTKLIATIGNFSMTDADLTGVQRGFDALYIFYAVSYKDESTKNKGQWRQNFCGYYTYAQSFYHNCALNHIDLVK